MITTELLTDNEECLYFCIDSNGPFTLLKIPMNSDSFVCPNVFWLLEIIALLCVKISYFTELVYLSPVGCVFHGIKLDVIP